MTLGLESTQVTEAAAGRAEIDTTVWLQNLGSYLHQVDSTLSISTVPTEPSRGDLVMLDDGEREEGLEWTQRAQTRK